VVVEAAVQEEQGRPLLGVNGEVRSKGFDRADIVRDVRFPLWSQPVGATLARSLLAGISKPKSLSRTLIWTHRYLVEKFWIGHANKDVTDKYAAQLKEDVEWRKDVAEKTGVGFALPASIEISIGLLGQPKVVRSEEAKAA